VESVQEKKREATVGKDSQKAKVLSLEWKSEGMMDDESGESMKPMGVGLGRMVDLAVHATL